jgi:uncharacterized membrane protein SirB2
MSETKDTYKTKFRLVIFSVIAVAINFAGYAYAQDRGGWADVGLLMFLAPVYDAILLIAGIVMMSVTSKKHPNASFGFHWLVVILLPVFLYIITAMIILSTSTGGC